MHCCVPSLFVGTRVRHCAKPWEWRNEEETLPHPLGHCHLHNTVERQAVSRWSQCSGVGARGGDGEERPHSRLLWVTTQVLLWLSTQVPFQSSLFPPTRSVFMGRRACLTQQGPKRPDPCSAQVNKGSKGWTRDPSPASCGLLPGALNLDLVSLEKSHAGTRGPGV